MQIIERILELIQKNDVTEYRVMKDCGLQTNSFTYWKKGRAIPGLDALIKIANYFNVSLDYLVGRTANGNATISNNTTINPVLSRISQLSDLQQIQVMAYIDGLQGVKTHDVEINTRKIVSEAINRGISKNKTTKAKETKIN